MRKLLIGSFLIASSFVHANFTGTWSGLGAAKTQKSKFECEEVFFKLYHSEDKFKIQEGGYNCSGLNAEYPYSIFTIKDSKLFYRGEVSGLIHSNEVIIFSKEDGFELTFKLSDDAKTLSVSEEWREGEDFLLIESQLNR